MNALPSTPKVKKEEIEEGEEEPIVRSTQSPSSPAMRHETEEEIAEEVIQAMTAEQETELQQWKANHPTEWKRIDDEIQRLRAERGEHKKWMEQMRVETAQLDALRNGMYYSTIDQDQVWRAKSVVVRPNEASFAQNLGRREAPTFIAKSMQDCEYETTTTELLATQHDETTPTVVVATENDCGYMVATFYSDRPPDNGISNTWECDIFGNKLLPVDPTVSLVPHSPESVEEYNDVVQGALAWMPLEENNNNSNSSSSNNNNTSSTTNY